MDGGVFCINGSSGYDVPSNGSDAYFIGHSSSWGWGTWKECWSYFNRDYRIISKIKKDNDLNEWYQVWGQNLEQMLVNNVYGITDSWAVFWALAVISQKGLCLTPYKSLINNIGFDGSGVHCGKGKSPLKLMSIEKESLRLPDKVEVVDNYKQIFESYFSYISPIEREKYYRDLLTSWLDIKINNRYIGKYLVVKGIKKISIWGTGNICNLLLRDIQQEIKVVSIVETNPNSIEYRGIPVISPESLESEIGAVIVIPGYDIKKIRRLVPCDIEKKLITINALIELSRDISNYTC